MRFADVDPTNDREGWLRQRRSGLGGSDVAAVLGVSKWGTAWSKYVDKVGAIPLDEGSNEQMRLGQKLEPVILELYEEATGFTVAHHQAMVLHPEHDWMFATVDALVFRGADGEFNPDDAIKGVDAKRTTQFSFDDGLPLDMVAQCQWSMLVSGLPRWDLAVLHPHSFRVYELEADYDDHAALQRIATEFWHNHVQAGVAPAVEAADNDRLAKVWPDATAETVEVDAALVAELVEVKAQQKILEARRDTLEATLKAKLGEASVGTIGGEKAISWPNQSDRRRFDEDSFKADNPFMVSRFTRTETVTFLDSKAISEKEPELFKKYDSPIRKFYTHKLKEH